MAAVEIRTSSSEDVAPLYYCFMEAFSDYFIRFNMDLEQFQRKLVRDGTDLRYTVAAFEGGQMIGFVMHGIGDWDGVRTAYNGGTGVIPSARGRKIVQSLYSYIVPKFNEQGVQQAMLEVLVLNERAIKVYEGLGYTVSRHFDCMKASAATIPKPHAAEGISVVPAVLPDWPIYRSFWSIEPAWPCSIEALQRSLDAKVWVEAKKDGQTIGYAVMFRQTGSIAQLAVHPDFRRQGIGTAMLRQLAQKSDSGQLSIINIDSRSGETLRFLKGFGFEDTFAQYEMILTIHT